MARGRMLSQSIAEDIEFNEMSIEAQMMYMRTIPFLDRDGLVNGHPAILHGKIAPLLTDMLPQMSAIIDEWIACGLVISYMDGKTIVLFFKGFAQNQIGMRYEREPESNFAPPPGYARTKSGLTNSNTPVEPPKNSVAGTLPEDCRQTAGRLPPEEKRREEKRREERGGKLPADDGKPPSAPQQRQSSSKPERKSGTVTHFDARKLDTNGLLPKNSGKTLIEIWREAFTWMPTAAQIRDMNERVTDSAKWRQITTDCALKGFRSYTNVIDVYLNGWRNALEAAIPHKAVSGDIGLNMGAI